MRGSWLVDVGRRADPCRGGPARCGNWRIPACVPSPPARPAALPRARNGDRVRRARLDRLQQLRAGADDRRRRACVDPVRGRSHRRLRRDPAGPARVALARDPGNDRDRGDLRLRGGVAVRPLHARGHAARRDHLLHRRRRDLRAAARVEAPAPPRAHARGRGGLQRPGRRPARDRVHRVDPAGRLRRARHGAPVRARDGDRRGRGHRGRDARGSRAAKRAPRQSRALPGGHAGDRRPRVRRRRHACTARASSPPTWPAWCWARRESRRSRR